MVSVKVGNLFDSKAQTLVNTVNCVGVMGKGIALEFKERFPDMFQDYVTRCKQKRVRLGEPYLFRRTVEPWILNFPTKDHWRSVSRLIDIEAGLRYLTGNYREWGIESLAVPPLGCGHGQLEWSIVGPTLYRHLDELQIPVELYAPLGTPDAELEPAFLRATCGLERRNKAYDGSRIPPGLIAIVEILRRIEDEPYHSPIGRTTFQKIAYFATQCDIPTELRYARGSYGPYAANLKKLITRVVNNGLIREERLGRMFAVRVGETFADARNAYEENLYQWRNEIEKIVDLFMRMNTHQAELAATVHFAAVELKQTGQPTEFDILRYIMEWKHRRRPPLEPKEVALTIRHLNMLSWIGATASNDLPVTEEELLNV